MCARSCRRRTGAAARPSPGGGEGSARHGALPDHLRSPIDRYPRVLGTRRRLLSLWGPAPLPSLARRGPSEVPDWGFFLAAARRIRRASKFRTGRTQSSISSAALLSPPLPKLLLPQRLRAITSLEIVWCPKLRRRENSDPSTVPEEEGHHLDPDLESLLNNILSPPRPPAPSAEDDEPATRDSVVGMRWAAHRPSCLRSELWRNLSDGTYVLVLVAPDNGGRPLAERVASPYPGKPLLPPLLQALGGGRGDGSSGGAGERGDVVKVIRSRKAHIS